MGQYNNRHKDDEECLKSSLSDSYFKTFSLPSQILKVTWGIKTYVQEM